MGVFTAMKTPISLEPPWRELTFKTRAPCKAETVYQTPSNIKNAATQWLLHHNC